MNTPKNVNVILGSKKIQLQKNAKNVICMKENVF